MAKFVRRHTAQQRTETRRPHWCSTTDAVAVPENCDAIFDRTGPIAPYFPPPCRAAASKPAQRTKIGIRGKKPESQNIASTRFADGLRGNDAYSLADIDHFAAGQVAAVAQHAHAGLAAAGQHGVVWRMLEADGREILTNATPGTQDPGLVL